jgi:Pyruvate/2-oxoacid:ferredoxin oxidoreductase delta subunit
MGKTFPRLATNVGTAMEWLEAAGRPARIHFVNRCEQDPSAKRREMIDAGLKVTSRRDLFLSLIQRARQATRAVEVDLSCKPEDDYLPGWRKRFARVYQENALPSSAAVYWPTIKIDDRCVNCGMCSMFCPSGALQIREEDGTAQHSFTSGYCLDCRICEMICSVGAIRRDRELVANPFEQITISSAAIMACKRCGDTTTTNPEGLCYWCQQENAIETGLMETYKSIFLSPGS